MAEPSILGALRDPQFRSDTLRNLVEALNGAKRSLTVGSLGAVGDMGNTLANLVRAGAGTAYHETTGRPIPQALEYRDPALDFGTSASLGNFAERQGWLPPQTGSIPETAGALLGPIVAMKAPDLAQSTLRGLVSALKSEPSRRMVEGLVDGMGARPKIFAGEGAQTADMQALAKAQQLEKAGAPERAIWSDTGWFRGADKKWRFEIDDSLARFNPSMADGGLVENAIQNGTPGMNFGPTVGPGMNGNLYHPALFDAYGKDLPQNTFIGNKNTLFGDGVQGAFDSATDSITLNAPVQPRDGRSTLLHELQHAVQQREGFAAGGNPSSISLLDMVPAERIESVKQSPLYRLQVAQGRDPKKALEGILAPYLDEFGGGNAGNARMDAYRRLAGEAEARAVQSRMDMTPEQRRATFPFDSYDVPRDKLILRDLLKGPAEASSEGAKFKPTMQQRLETAQVNAESMLGLPKNNTAIDRAKALGAQPISGIPLEMINAPSKYLDDAYELGMKAKQINPDINKWARGAYEKELGAFPWEMERGPAWEAFFEAGNRGYEKPPVATGYRYGDLPDKGRSWNHRDNIPEYGVSMAEVDHPIAGSWSDPISKMFIEAQGRPRVDVGGYLHPIRTGTDGEPLLVGAGKLKGDFKISSGKERSRFAAFDPARRNESDLLASFAGAGILSPLVLEQLAEPRDKKDKSRK